MFLLIDSIKYRRIPKLPKSMLRFSKGHLFAIMSSENILWKTCTRLYIFISNLLVSFDLYYPINLVTTFNWPPTHDTSNNQLLVICHARSKRDVTKPFIQKRGDALRITLVLKIGLKKFLSINFHQKMSHWRIDIWSIKFLNTYIQKWQYLILMVNNCIFMGWCPSPPGLFPVEITYEHFNLCKKEKLYYCISGKFCSCSTFTISALIIEA